MLSRPNCASLSILDLGAGDGSLRTALKQWAANQGWRWEITNLDTRLAALGLNSRHASVAGSGAALPFRQDSFDLVIASQMIHHLSEGEAKRLLSEAWRVARQGIFLCDLHRNAFLYAVLWVLFWFQRFPSSFRGDALLSVRRSWRVRELKRLAVESGVGQAEVRLYFGARVVLWARKSGGYGTGDLKSEGQSPVIR